MKLTIPKAVRPAIALISVLLASLAIIGCSAFKNGAPPTSLESKLFTVVTNYQPQVQVVTNLVPVTLYRTNVQEVTAFQTNLQGVTQTVTNFQTVVVPQTVTNAVVVQQTNEVPTYKYAPNSTVTGAEGLVSSIPVYGTLASTAMAGIAALWGWIRSSKNYNTGATLAQSIETMREFVKNLPNGATYDTALTQWLQQHQAETGTITTVLQMLQNDVSNQDAKIAAQQVQAAIAALNPSALPAGTTQAAAKV